MPAAFQDGPPGQRETKQHKEHRVFLATELHGFSRMKMGIPLSVSIREIPWLKFFFFTFAPGKYPGNQANQEG